MKDRKFLLWLHGKMVKEGSNPDYDFMLKLKAVAKATDPEKETSNIKGQINVK